MPGYRKPGITTRRRWVKPVGMITLVITCFVYTFLLLILPRQLLVAFSVPLMVLALLIVWALPISKAPPRTAMQRLFWAFSISLVLWPNYLALVIPGLPWISAARLTGAPLVVLLLFNASRSEPFRKEMKALLSGSPAIVRLVAAFGIIQVISLAFADSPFLSFNRVFNNEIGWTGIFFAAVWAFRDEKAMERWALTFCFMAAVLGLIAIAEAQAGHVLWSQSIPSFFNIDENYAAEILAGFYRLDGTYRVIATSTTPLSFGELMAMTVPFLLFAVERRPTPRVIFAALVLEGLIVYALIQADARLGFVGLIVGHVIYLILYAITNYRKNPNSLLAGSLLISLPVMAMLLASAVLLVGRIRKRVLGGGVHQYSDDARQEQAGIALVKIWESPIFGFGSGQGGAKLGYYTPGGKLTIDSYYISILMDYGFVGFFVYYGMLIVAIVKATQIALARRDLTGQLASAFSAFLTSYIIIKMVLSQEANQPLMFIVLAGVVVLSYRHRESLPKVLPAR